MDSEIKNKIIKIFKREFLFFILFFIIGYFLFPLLASLINLKIYIKITKLLFSGSVETWIIILLPYFAFSLFRLNKSPDTMQEVEILTSEEEKERIKRKFKKVFCGFIIFIIVIAISYFFYPKHTYKNFYDEEKYCQCFGINNKFEPNILVWGHDEEWEACFGILYNCK